MPILIALLPFLLQLLQWLFGDDGPFRRKRDERFLVKFIQRARRIEQRAIERGLVVPDEDDPPTKRILMKNGNGKNG